MAMRYLSPVHRAYRQIAIYFEEPCAEVGLIPQEGHLVSYLAAYGPCPVAEVHRVLGLKRSTLSSMLGRLEARGLLRRIPHPSDRRSLHVELEADGRQLAATLQERGEALEAAIEQRVDAADCAGFDAVLAAIAAVTEVEVRPVITQQSAHEDTEL
ncbi:MAG: MarR family transcriptional regulator [Planctomycetota bacterium]